MLHGEFPLNSGRIRMFFFPKTICIPRGIIPQNFSSTDLVVSEKLANKQTHTYTNSLMSIHKLPKSFLTLIFEDNSLLTHIKYSMDQYTHAKVPNSQNGKKKLKYNNHFGLFVLASLPRILLFCLNLFLIIFGALS